MDDSAVSTSRPATPALVHSPSTARSSFSLRETQAVRPQSMRQPSWGKRHASLDSPRERPTVVPPGDFSSSMPSSALNGPPAPDPPHIHTPPSSPSAYAYPFLPPYEPRGEDRPSVKVDIYPDKYLLTCRMPHFDHSSITVATRRGRLLVVAADRWDALEPAPLSLDPALIPSPPQPAHFERRITFGWDADMQRIRAEFDGVCLHVTVPRRMAQSLGLSPHPSRASAPGLMGSDLEMSKGRSESDPPPRTTSRRDVAWPLG